MSRMINGTELIAALHSPNQGRTKDFQMQLVPLYRPQKGGRLGEPRACGALLGIEPSPGLQVQSTITTMHYCAQPLHYPLRVIDIKSLYCTYSWIIFSGNNQGASIALPRYYCVYAHVFSHGSRECFVVGRCGLANIGGIMRHWLWGTDTPATLSKFDHSFQLKVKCMFKKSGASFS